MNSLYGLQGFIILILSIIISFLFSKFTTLKPLVNFKNKFEYIPIITSNLYADLIIIFITFSGILGYKEKSWKILTNWYKKYRLSAMIADIFIGVLYILLARYLVYKFKFNLNLFEFILFAVSIQLILDFSFYLFFSVIPKGKNNMLDLFKEWAKYAKLDALWGDSILVVVSILIASLLNELTFDSNIIILLIGIYITPYIIYMKD